MGSCMQFPTRAHLGETLLSGLFGSTALRDCMDTTTFLFNLLPVLQPGKQPAWIRMAHLPSGSGWQ